MTPKFAPMILDNIVIDNLAEKGGGLRFCFFLGALPEPLVLGNIIVGNTASYRGGGVDCEDADPIMYHTTIEGNDAPAGGGVYSFSGGEVTLINSIVANSTQGGGLCADAASSIVTGYCDVWNNFGGNYIGCSPSSTDISCSPLYCDVDHNDFRLYEISGCQGTGEGGADIGAKGVGCFSISGVQFYDNFSDQDDEEWLIETAGDGEMSIVAGTYQGSSSQPGSWAMSRVVGSVLAFEDFHYRVDFLPESEIMPPTGFVDFYLRFTDFAQSYLVRLGVDVGELWKFTPLGREFLLGFPFDFIPDEWSHIHFIAVGDELSGYLSGADGDESLLFLYHDIDSPILAGTVGVGVTENGPALASFDNILVALVDVSAVPITGEPACSWVADDGQILVQVRPSLFCLRTRIQYEMPATGRLTLQLYDLGGRRIRSLLDRVVDAGTGGVVWNGASQNGNPMPAGIYFYRARAFANTATGKMQLLR